MDATVDSEMDNLISDLQRLIRQPSVSARKQGITQCASLVASIMNNSGIGAEILYLDDRAEHHSGDIKAHPVVYGEVKSKSNPDGKTILFYNH